MAQKEELMITGKKDDYRACRRCFWCFAQAYILRSRITKQTTKPKNDGESSIVTAFEKGRFAP
ncbi:MAG: hypothetical protein L6V93_19805 [Clostridiales bacterium]|nr:MAG: hypothetical protein L6V93_19805 [Clostridiales bacterium]